jgi:hypothetical protein
MRKRKEWVEGAPALAFSIESFATAHAIGRNKVFEEIARGRLTARKVDNRTIITAEDAEIWRRSLPLAGSIEDVTR